MLLLLLLWCLWLWLLRRRACYFAILWGGCRCWFSVSKCIRTTHRPRDDAAAITSKPSTDPASRASAMVRSASLHGLDVTPAIERTWGTCTYHPICTTEWCAAEQKAMQPEERRDRDGKGRANGLVATLIDALTPSLPFTMLFRSSPFTHPHATNIQRNDLTCGLRGRHEEAKRGATGLLHVHYSALTR